MNTETLYKYLDSFIFRNDVLLNTPHIENKTYNDKEYDNLVKEYFKRLPYSNLSDEYTIRFADCGTTFINRLFKLYTDDNTLIISTKYEHETVVKNLDTCKNVYLLDNTELRSGLSKALKAEIDKFKKVFVYIIGTQISTGEITPQFYCTELKEYLIENNISFKFLLDDVHGMFFFPRDYSIFDYILYTAHAIIPQYNMGMLISKKNAAIGDKIYNWANDYLPRLDRMFILNTNLAMFKNILLDYFGDLIGKNTCIKPATFSVNHIFALHTYNLRFKKGTYEELKKYGIVISEHDMPINFIRIRFQEFLLQEPKKAIEGLELARKTLIEAINLAKIKGDI